MDERLIEEIVKEVMASMGGATKEKPVRENAFKLSKKDYPLGQKRPELVKSPTGKTLEDMSLDKVMDGEVMPKDLRISGEVLEYQAQIAESVGRVAFAKNLRRAAELTNIPDDRILEIYNALRPYRSTEEDLLNIADELENKFGAKINAQFVREATNVYKQRKRLKEHR